MPKRERLSQRFGIATLVTVSFQLPSHFPPCVLSALVIGVQHHKLGQILLAIFDPKIPRVGGSRSTAIKSMEVCLTESLFDPFGGLGSSFTGADQTRSERIMWDRVIQSLDSTRYLHCVDGNCNM
jgi:hypothetical protein